MAEEYLWGVAPRSAGDPLIASGTSDDLDSARQEVERVLGLNRRVTSWGTVAGPGGYHAVCRRDGAGGFSWDSRGGTPGAAKSGPRRPGPGRRRGNPGRLYRDAKNDYWQVRSRRARRTLAVRRFARAVVIVAAIAVVLAAAIYLAGHGRP
ncbi:MAG: hypothetical protein FWE35_21540 [Streptosporangiales bacterium]|nr:hypothetical protein [Streptosporangiales bacterium]